MPKKIAKTTRLVRVKLDFTIDVGRDITTWPHELKALDRIVASGGVNGASYVRANSAHFIRRGLEAITTRATRRQLRVIDVHVKEALVFDKAKRRPSKRKGRR